MHVVLNWCLQGSVLAAVTALGLWATPRTSATTRYRVWWIALLLVLLLPVIPALTTLPGGAAAPIDAAVAIAPMPMSLPALPAWPTVAGLIGWMLWVVVMLARGVASFISLRQSRRGATPFSAAREARLPHWLAVRSTGRSARLLCSNRVASAAVLGLGGAVIAVSPVAAGRLSDAELDQVLLHEWAHVQRRDDFARLAQIIIRIVAGLHPAVWWIGRRLEIEREIACDDYAVNITGAARTLARSLTKLAEAPGEMRPTLAPGALVASQLTRRVRSLLDPRRNTSTSGGGGLLGSAAATLVLAAVILSRVELVVAASPLILPVPVGLTSQLTSAPELRPAVRLEDGPRAVPAQPAIASAPEVERSTPPTPSPDRSGRRASAAGPVPVQTPLAPLPLARVESGPWQVPDLPVLPGVDPVPASGSSASAVAADEESAERAPAITPWGAAAEAGISVGRGSQKAASATAEAGTVVGRSSQKAAVATAGFFSKLGRKIAGSF